MRFNSIVLAAGGLVSLAGGNGDEPSVASAQPVVVKTVPEAGTKGIDPGTTEIRVTFSKDMTDGSWSWTTVSEATFPKTTGKPWYERDRRTCVLPVTLEPGKTYALWINSPKFGNFKDVGGQAAVPYLLTFETKKIPKAADPARRPA